MRTVQNNDGLVLGFAPDHLSYSTGLGWAQAAFRVHRISTGARHVLSTSIKRSIYHALLVWTHEHTDLLSQLASAPSASKALQQPVGLVPRRARTAVRPRQPDLTLLKTSGASGAERQNRLMADLGLGVGPPGPRSSQMPSRDQKPSTRHWIIHLNEFLFREFIFRFGQSSEGYERRRQEYTDKRRRKINENRTRCALHLPAIGQFMHPVICTSEPSARIRRPALTEPR